VLLSFNVLCAPQLAAAQTAAQHRQKAIEPSQKSWDQTIANYRMALQLEPDGARTRYKLALTRQRGKEAESRREFEQAFEISPELKNAARPQ
jgi:tetratricopeptide (TPR) repeat protein